MFKNFLITVSRQLWRNRLFTSLNIIGLSVCISIVWIIFRMVSFEYSFDKKIPDTENIYQVVARDQDNGEEKIGGFAGVSLPVFNTLKNDITGVSVVVPMYYKYPNKLTFQNEDGKPVQFNPGDEDIELVSTTADYFDLLGYQWLAGNSKTALDAPDKMVLTDEKAREYFPSLTPQELVGKTLVYDDTLVRHISGVVAQLAFPNSFSENNQQFIPLYKSDLANNNWGGKNSANLIYIKPEKGHDPARIMAQLNAIDLKNNQESYKKYKYKSWYEVLPLKEKHFEPQYAAQTRAADKKVLKGLIITGAFLLLLACINYINLSTAMLPSRAREIGIRKTLGSSSRSLIIRFIGETLIVTMLAAILSFALTSLGLKIFKDFLPDGMLEYMDFGGMALFILILIVSIALFSGLYPAYLSSRIQTVNVLKGVTEKVIGKNQFSLRKTLIIFQFLIAQIFIIGSIIIYQQINFALHKDLGFNKNGVITVQVPHYIQDDPKFKDKHFVLMNELQRDPNIKTISMGIRPMDNILLGNIFSYSKEDETIQEQVNMKFADTNYLHVYNLQLIAGRNFLASDTMNELVLNEKAAKAFGFNSAEEAVGKMLGQMGNNKFHPIVGVVRDFHQFGVKSEIAPALITTNRSSGASVLNIRLSDNMDAWASAIQHIEKEWKKLYAGIPFAYKFYDETVEKFYVEEKKMQTLVRTATGIAVVISCLGLFGLATLTSFKRTKEVGIRKVLGASVASIVQLLSREFLGLVLISVLVATPIAWWLMNAWLSDFAFRIEIKWWIFFIAALAACFIALFTVSYQAIKAARANPVKSLRTE